MLLKTFLCVERDYTVPKHIHLISWNVYKEFDVYEKLLQVAKWQENPLFCENGKKHPIPDKLHFGCFGVYIPFWAMRGTFDRF